jgi:ribosomal protein S18 acetylase RimI-like enzyme
MMTTSHDTTSPQVTDATSGGPAETVATPENVVIRAALPVEYDQVGEITFAAYAHDELLADDFDYGAELRAAAVRARDNDLLVAVDATSGAVLGTVTFCLPDSDHAELARPGEAEFRMLAVAPEARGRGVGEALVRECLERATRLRCSRVVISTRWNMRPAHRLYRRLGFVRDPSRDWWPIPSIELICYTREL